MRRIVLFNLLLFALSFAACTNDEAPSASAPKPRPAKVETQTIESTSLVENRSFLGEVRNAESTVLAAGGSGKVLRVEVLAGDEVKRGQVLVQLDGGILRARLGEVQADLARKEVELDQARRDAARFTELSEQGHFPRSQAEEITSRRAALEADVAGQQAAVRRLREELSQMRIVAPFDGVVAARHVSPGQWLQTGEPALDLTSRGELEVHVRVPARVLDLLSGAEAVVIEHRDERLEATIGGVVGSLDPRTRTAMLRVVPSTTPPWLREGAALNVSIGLKRGGDHQVVVTSDALVHGASGTRIFRVKEGKADPLNVSIITQVGDHALVRSEQLAVGDEIVRRGNERLRPGQDLQVQP